MDQESPAGLRLIAITIDKGCAKKGGSQAAAEAGPSLCLLPGHPFSFLHPWRMGSESIRTKLQDPGVGRGALISGVIFVTSSGVWVRLGRRGAVGEHRESRERPAQSAKQILTPP